jgi:hypothetical protein
MIDNKFVLRWSGRAMRAPTWLGVLAAPRDSTEAAFLTALGPYGQKAHNLGGIYKGVSPLYTLFSVHFFGVRQKSEQ